MTSYLTLADALSADIAAGRLRPGERLTPQREFAYARGVAASTAARVYRELFRRGLVTGEVGRGTFVRDPTAGPRSLLSEPAAAPIDLEFNFPMVVGQRETLAASVAKLWRSPRCDFFGPLATREQGLGRLAADLMARGGWSPASETIVFSGGGKQAIAAVLSALFPNGGRLGVETLTYPWIKAIAARLHIDLAPIEVDDQGVSPETLSRAHRRAAFQAIYVQPALHNPLGVSMSAARRKLVAEWLRARRLTAIEDGIWGFLVDAPPLAAAAPDHVVVVDSLSKRLTPDLSLGFIVAPPHLQSSIADALRAGGWGAATAAMTVCRHWIADGTAAMVTELKRQAATQRQELARNVLAELDVSGDRRAYHLWLRLPAHWRADAFTAAALRQGIALAPGAAFAATPGVAPNSVRLALGSPDLDVLRDALERLKRLANADPHLVDRG